MIRRLKRQFQLRVYAVLLLIAALAGVFAWFSDRPRRQKRVIELTQRVGGFVSHDREHIPPIQPPRRSRSAVASLPGQNKAPLERGRSALSWLREQMGREFAHNLTRISFDGAKVRDEDLATLSGLSHLELLYLNGTALTDAGLVHLRDLWNLRVLELRETKIGDAGVSHLRGLKKLEELYLDRTRVGDEGLTYLGGMTELRELHLGHTAVGDAGLSHLRGLTKLQVLTLQRTRITDSGLVHLKGLKSLRSLDLEGTDVTDMGLQHLTGLTDLSVLFLGGNSRFGGRDPATQAGPSRGSDFRQGAGRLLADWPAVQASLRRAYRVTVRSTMRLLAWPEQV